MTLARFYESLGGSLPAVLARIPSEAMVRKFARMYAGDTSCVELVRAVERSDWAAAFLAAHTLKGVALNLGLSNLAAPAVELTEALRPCVPEGVDVEPLMATLRKAYNETVEALGE